MVFLSGYFMIIYYVLVMVKPLGHFHLEIFFEKMERQEKYEQRHLNNYIIDQNKPKIWNCICAQ